MPERIVHSIEPVFDERSRVLVLGSIPSPKSRETGFFYGHPRNRFWPVLAEIFDEPVPETSEDKRAMLLRRHVALWDVVASCEIEGASDASIKNAQPNDLDRIFKTADIQAVFTTGAKAAELYDRLCAKRYDIPHIALPSTSPANAKASMESLAEAYGEALLPRLEPSWRPPVLGVDRVVALEREIERTGTPLSILMERAGRFLAYEAIKLGETHANGESAGASSAQQETASAKPRSTDNAPSNETIALRFTDSARNASQEKENRAQRAFDSAPARVASPSHRNPRFTVLCGMGNNGGDGWVAARILAERGFEVAAVSAISADELRAQPAHDAAVRACEVLDKHAYARVVVNPDENELHCTLGHADVIIDALLGTGFAGDSMHAPFDAWTIAANERRSAGAAIIAADVPSGLSAQTGKAAQPCMKADITVTMIASKPGLETPYAFAFCGDVRVAPISYIEPLLEGNEAKLEEAQTTGEHAPAHIAQNEDEPKTEERNRIPASDSRYADADERMQAGAPKATARKAPASARSEFLRAEAEDDDGYDPYSDRRPEPEALFQRDPWN